MRKSPVNNETWLEWTVHVTLVPEVGPIPLCGLCGNTGIIQMQGVKSPTGAVLPAITGYCICPNGRVGHFRQKKAQLRSGPRGR